MNVLGKNEVKDKMTKTRKHKPSKERQILQASTKLHDIKLVKIHCTKTIACALIIVKKPHRNAF